MSVEKLLIPISVEIERALSILARQIILVMYLLCESRQPSEFEKNSIQKKKSHAKISNREFSLRR